MVPTTLTITLLFQVLILAVTANPIRRVNISPVTLPIARRVNLTTVHNLVRHDQARAKALRDRKTFKAADDPAAVDIPVDNQAITYVATVGFGNPPTDYSLIIDTGSSNTWTGAQTFNKTKPKPYGYTKTTRLAGSLVGVIYGSGAFFGIELLDMVTLAPGLDIPNQSVGNAIFSSGFSGVDGILGIGPTDLTLGTTFPGFRTPVPTITDNLFSSGKIPSNQVGIYFQPRGGANTVNGEMTFGGIDTSKTTSAITWIPVTTTSPSSAYWGINQNITYGDTATSIPILSNSAGIVDTGTTLILIATDAFNAYMQATGAVADENTGLLRLTTSQYDILQSLFFTAGGTTFELTPNAQIWPRSLNTLIGGTSDLIYLIVGNIGTNSGSGLDFINGYSFLERFYSVFDSGNNRVGLATTSYTNSMINL